MKIAMFAQLVEDLGAEILTFTKRETSDGNVYSIGIVEPAPVTFDEPLEKAEKPVEAIKTDNAAPYFSIVKGYVRDGTADKHIKVGDKVTLPHFKIPAAKDCEGEEFDEIDLENVVITAVHVEPHRVVFNFEDILFRHDVDYKESGKPFEETPLGVYLAKHFTKALEEYTGKVNVSLLSKDNVFNENSKNFMPYFKPVKNRIKALAFENDTWWWWLGTPYASNSTAFCYVNHYGYSHVNIASNTGGGVAPAFEFTADSE